MSWQEGEWGRSYNGVCCRVGSQWGGRIMGAEAGVHNKFAEVWGLWKVTERGLMKRSWVDGAEERE